MSEPTHEPPEYDVYPAIDGTRPVEPLPKSNAHLAPVRPVLESEGVATTYPEVSPTGLPRIPTEYVPWLLFGAPVLTAGLMSASQAVDGNAARAILMGTAAAIGTAAGIISQGYRKPPQK